MTLTVYGANVSPFVRKVRVMLAEKGVPYTLENVNVFKMPDWFVKMSPLKRIPVLKDDEVGPEATLADSSVIAAYLEMKYPSPALYPKGAFDHARALWFEEYADSEMAAAGGLGIFRTIVLPQLAGKAPDIATAKATLAEKLPRFWDYLDGELEGKQYFVGGAFSIADISVGTQFCNLRHAGVKVDAARWPALAAFVERTLDRPSFAACLREETPIFSKPVDFAA